MNAVLAVGVGFLIALFFIQQIFDFIMTPLAHLLPPGGTLVCTMAHEASRS